MLGFTFEEIFERHRGLNALSVWILRQSVCSHHRQMHGLLRLRHTAQHVKLGFEIKRLSFAFILSPDSNHNIICHAILSPTICFSVPISVASIIPS